MSSTGRRRPVLKVYTSVCTLQGVKRGELERRLRELGWYFLKDGGKHAIWAHAVKSHKIYVPRHPKINSNTARAILREAAR